MSFAEVQELIEVPTIAYLCSLFHEPLGTPEFEIEELEDALVYNTKSDDDMFGSNFLDNIVISLLKECIPTYKSKLTCMNYSLYLSQFLTSRIEEHEEDYSAVKCNIVNPFNEDKQEFSQLSLKEKVSLILQLIDLRLDTEDAPERIKDIPVESLRLEHMGEDSDGARYWYFFGTRLYKEVRPQRKSKPKKEKAEKPDTKTKKESKSKKSKKEEIVNDTSDCKIENDDTSPSPTPGWFLICRTEKDWTDLVETLRKSKKKADKELHQILNENFLPQVLKMLQEKEKEERIKLLMMNKRSSSRITKKEQEKKIEEEQRRREEELEEEMRQKREEEEARKRLKENYNRRSKMARDTRHKEMMEKQLLEEESKQSRESREQRLLERELKRLSNQAEIMEVEEKKTRLDTERLRREAVERDHDYLGSRAVRQDANTNGGGAAASRRRGTQRAAAKREWHRLADFDDGNHRSIRF